MSLRRLVVIALSVVGVVLLAIVLYVGLVDLGRHKARIEAVVTKQLGRPFAIDGALQLKLFPSIQVLAESVRVANAEWGSKPQMVEIGHFSTHVGLRSLISGPVDIRSFELSDVSVVLEKNRDGKGNWVFGGKPEEPTPSGSATKVPAVIQHGKLRNVEVTYREPGKPDRVARVETLTIEPGADGLLAISGNGKFDVYRTALQGHVGPIAALFAGRNIRVDVEGAIERLRLDLNGSIGRLDPLAGANLALKLQHPDIGKMLENLRLPVVATGILTVDAQLKEAAKLTQLDFDAKLGDITAKSNGTLRSLGLPGSDLRFEVEVADAARVAKVFGVDGVPAEVLTVSGRVASTPKEIKLDGVSARLAGAKLTADGTIRVARERGADLRFELGVENLMKLRKGLPELPVSMSGEFVESRDKVELKNLRSRIGKTEISGWASMARNGKKHIEADLASPSLDLTPFSKKNADDKAKSGGEPSASPADAKEPAKKPKGKYVFSDAPIKLDGLKRADAKLHFVAKEVKVGTGMLKDVDGTLIADAGQLAFEGSAMGGFEGTLKSVMQLKTTSDGAADVELNVTAKNMRAGFAAGDGIDPRLVPPTSIDLKLRSSGASAHKLASSANGQVLVTQGPGKTKGDFLSMFGGDILAQLASKLNPFASQDPYTQLDCTVARVDIVDGRAAVEPVLMQSKKVTVTASGKVDFHTEDLTVDFDTRPREGIGVSPGMFTNPFIKLEGTLASPRIAVGAKGAASGAVAVATAGVSVVAKGVMDRARGEVDVCKKTLEKATHPAAAAHVGDSLCGHSATAIALSSQSNTAREILFGVADGTATRTSQALAGAHRMASLNRCRSLAECNAESQNLEMTNRETLKTSTQGPLSSEELRLIDAWWRACNYLSVGMIYLRDDPLLREPLKPEHVKHRLLGHWGASPALSFVWAHLNRVIKRDALDMIFMAGPGHGAPGVLGPAYLEGTYSEIYSDKSEDLEGMQKFFKQFSFPGHIGSHVTPETPGSIHEGGELGYSLAHAYGAALDNPELIVACVVGDGEAETGPLATAWHSNKFINPVRDGAVLPILNLNGYKIANPTVLARISHEELESLMVGYGYTPWFVEGSDPDNMHQKMAATLDAIVAEIRGIWKKARDSGNAERPRWPMIVLRAPKGWTGPKEVGGRKVEGSWRSHQVPFSDVRDNPANMKLLEGWMRSYKPDELFDAGGRLKPQLKALAPEGRRRMSANPHANGGLLRKELKLPDFRDYAVKVPPAGRVLHENTKPLGEFLRDVMRNNMTSFRVFGPDETASNRLQSIYEVSKKTWMADLLPEDADGGELARDGRVMEILSEHTLMGWLEGYLLTGRHGFFHTYEAFAHVVDSMFNQHAKWLDVCKNHVPWRASVSSQNILLSSTVWRQDHNGFSHQDPGFIDVVTNKSPTVTRVYLPPDANTLLVVADQCLRSKDCINVIVADKQKHLQFTTIDEATVHCAKGIGIWGRASTDQGTEPDVVMASCGDVVTQEALAATAILRERLPDLKVRFVNVVDLFKLQPATEHPHGSTEREFDGLFTLDKPVIFNFHGYPWLIHKLAYRFRNHENMHVRGYKEKGNINTPLELAIINQIDRFDLVIDVIERVPGLAARAAHLKEEMRGAIIDNLEFARTEGTDRAEITNWVWPW